MTNYSQTISNGIVSIEDGTKAAEEYTPSRKVRVELHFDTNEADPQSILDAVCLIAENKVRTLLGRPTLATLGDSTAPTAASTAAPEKLKATRTKKAEPAPKEELKSEADELDLGSASEETTQTSDDLGLEDLEENGEDQSLDDIFGTEPAPAPKLITDAELGSAAMARNEATKNAVAIRKLVASFTEGNQPTNRNARDIPQDKRQAFLDALKEIKPV